MFNFHKWITFKIVDNFFVKHFVNFKNIFSFAPHLLNKRNTSTTNEFFLKLTFIFKCLKPS